jgi:hypothetical protein
MLAMASETRAGIDILHGLSEAWLGEAVDCMRIDRPRVTGAAIGTVRRRVAEECRRRPKPDPIADFGLHLLPKGSRRRFMAGRAGKIGMSRRHRSWIEESEMNRRPCESNGEKDPEQRTAGDNSGLEQHDPTPRSCTGQIAEMPLP